MIKRKLITILLMFFLSACNLQLVESQETSGLALTITAQALLIQQGSSVAPVEQVVVVITATPDSAVSATTETVVPAPIVAVSPPTGAVTVTVSTATNCRNGPGQNFSIVYGMPVNQVAEVVAKNTYSSYWIIKIPGSANTCWLWGQYATVTGNTASLSEVVTPTSAATKTSTATITPSITVAAPVIPTAPSNLSEQNTCTYSADTWDIEGTLSWTDNSNNEVGFNIYNQNLQNPNSKDVLLSSVGPNTTSYNFSYTSGTPTNLIALKVEAFNNSGISNRASVNIVLNCPPRP